MLAGESTNQSVSSSGLGSGGSDGGGCCCSESGGRFLLVTIQVKADDWLGP
jgi:hypothetical protein